MNRIKVQVYFYVYIDKTVIRSFEIKRVDGVSDSNDVVKS